MKRSSGSSARIGASRIQEGLPRAPGSQNGYGVGMARERTPNEVSAGGVVVRRAGTPGWEVCLINVRGRWEIPKGHPEKGETPEVAALREVSEETGLEGPSLRIIADLPPSNYVFRAGGRLIFKRVDTFLIACDGNGRLMPQQSEVEDARWMPFDEARNLAAFRDTKLLLDEAVVALKRHSRSKV